MVFTPPLSPTATKVSYRIRGPEIREGLEPVIVGKRGAKVKAEEGISNPDQLIAARVVNTSNTLGEILVELPEVYQMSVGWTLVIVDANGKHQVGRITDASGRRILLSIDSALVINPEVGRGIRIGLVTK